MQATYDAFVEKAAAGRHTTPEKIDAVAQGRVWTGQQAKQIGLVDELGGLDRALALAKEQAQDRPRRRSRAGGLPAEAVALRIARQPVRHLGARRAAVGVPRPRTTAARCRRSPPRCASSAAASRWRSCRTCSCTKSRTGVRGSRFGARSSRRIVESTTPRSACCGILEPLSHRARRTREPANPRPRARNPRSIVLSQRRTIDGRSAALSDRDAGLPARLRHGLARLRDHRRRAPALLLATVLVATQAGSATGSTGRVRANCQERAHFGPVALPAAAHQRSGLAVLAAVIAIAGKFVIRFRGKHIFNPTNGARRRACCC